MTTIQGQQEVRSFRFCMGSSSLVLSGVVFDHWPTHGYIRVLHRAFQVIELQACHRVFAPSRRAQDRERLLVLPRPSTLSHWPSPSSWSSWIFEGFPVHLSLSPFCSTCALLRGRRRCPGFNRRAKRSFIPYVFEHMNIFRKVPCYSAGASFLVQGFVLCPSLKSGGARIALVRFTLLNDAAPNNNEETCILIPIFLLPVEWIFSKKNLETQPNCVDSFNNATDPFTPLSSTF